MLRSFARVHFCLEAILDEQFDISMTSHAKGIIKVRMNLFYNVSLCKVRTVCMELLWELQMRENIPSNNINRRHMLSDTAIFAKI
jgi:hypothetical protein